MTSDSWRAVVAVIGHHIDVQCVCDADLVLSLQGKRTRASFRGASLGDRSSRGRFFASTAWSHCDDGACGSPEHNDRDLPVSLQLATATRVPTAAVKSGHCSESEGPRGTMQFGIAQLLLGVNAFLLPANNIVTHLACGAPAHGHALAGRCLADTH